MLGYFELNKVSPTPGPAAAVRPCARRPAALQTTTEDAERRRQQMTDASEKNNTSPLGGPVILLSVYIH